jgi:hypothetical protein
MAYGYVVMHSTYASYNNLPHRSIKEEKHVAHKVE